MITEHHDQLAAHPEGEEAAEPGGVVGQEEVEVLLDEGEDAEEGEAEGAGRQPPRLPHLLQEEDSEQGGKK